MTLTHNFAHAKQGDIIAFGAYPHTASGTGTTPIQWRVLENTSIELFLLCEYIIDCKRYHLEGVDISWRDCDIRKWLNNEFFKIAFTETEQEQIKTITCTDNGEGSPDTEDRVFLLSVTEVNEFTDPGDGATKRRAIGTEYAKTKKTTVATYTSTIKTLRKTIL